MISEWYIQYNQFYYVLEAICKLSAQKGYVCQLNVMTRMHHEHLEFKTLQRRTPVPPAEFGQLHTLTNINVINCIMFLNDFANYQPKSFQFVN